MLEVAVWILAVATLVNAVVVLNGAGDPDFDLSSGSAEAEIYLSRDQDGKPMVSKKLDAPQRGKKLYMNKQMSLMGGSTAKPSDSRTKKPWRNLLDKLSNVSEVPSFEESGQVKSPLRIIVNDVVEQSEEPKQNSDVKSILEQMEIAKKWFPILLRRAIGNMLNNNTKKELNKLVEQLTFRTWKSEDFNGSEQKFVDWMLTVPFHARKQGESEVDLEQRLLQKRSSCCSCCDQNECPCCQPCVMNIFNNSHIGCVVLRSDGKLPSAGCSPVDCSSLKCLCDKSDGFNLDYISNCKSFECGCTTTTTECPTTTTEASCEDSLPHVQYETSSFAPYNCKCSTPSSYQQPPPPPPSFYQTPTHHEQSHHPRPIYPWYNYPDPEYRPNSANYGPDSYEHHYDPYKNFPFDIPSSEIEECSREELDCSSNYHVKRDPQHMDKDWIHNPSAQKTTKFPSPHPGKHSEEDSVRLIIDLPPTFDSQEVRQDSNLQNTLTKIGLSLNSERPAVVKTLEASQNSRNGRTYPAPRIQQSLPNFNSHESGPLQRPF